MHLSIDLFTPTITFVDKREEGKKGLLKVEFRRVASRVYVSIFDRLKEQSSVRTPAARACHGSAAHARPTECSSSGEQPAARYHLA